MNQPAAVPFRHADVPALLKLVVNRKNFQQKRAAARSDADAPEIDQLVFIPFKKKFRHRPGDRIAVRIVSALPGGDLEAELK